MIAQRKYLYILAGVMVALVLVLAVSPAAVEAGTISDGTYTLTWPDYSRLSPVNSCEPWNDPTANSVTVSGLDGVDVWVAFIFADPTWVPDPNDPSSSPVITSSVEQFTNVSDELTVPVPYPTDVTAWPVLASGEQSIDAGAVAFVFPPGSDPIRLRATQWRVTCTLPPPPPPPPPVADEGCTPGFWRQEQHFDSWVGYSPTDDFETVFGVDASFDPHTLLDAVWLGGGGEQALARHAVAALLDSTSLDNYAYTTTDVITMVQTAYATGAFEDIKDLFETANEQFCPLD
jgi:hypothetical protein